MIIIGMTKGACSMVGYSGNDALLVGVECHITNGLPDSKEILPVHISEALQYRRQSAFLDEAAYSH